VRSATWAACFARLAALAVAALHPACSARAPAPADELASELRRLYAPPSGPEARWRRPRPVKLRDGREVPRESAYRDDPAFVAAAERLLASAERDDAAFGAWLLGTLPEALWSAAEPVLVRALAHADPSAAFEAALALAASGSPAALPGLERAASGASSADVRTAARWAAAEIARRSSGRSVETEARGVRALARGPSDGALAPGFRRGVSWWSEDQPDHGAASFRLLASLGVTWVSIHTWDPLQRGLDDPVLAPRGGFLQGFPDLAALVSAAHAAGLSVMVKPHLEMRGFEQPDHNRIAMRNPRDWARWFESYTSYLLPYAREAQAAGADLFCVGRELDATVVAREVDWRRLIGRIRAEFKGPLTYSSNFDTFPKIGFWDALDFIGVSAYYPLAEEPDPQLAALEAGWERALVPLDAAARRWRRPVLLTEAGFPAVASAARTPWREERTTADVWLQARCYEATLRALSRHPSVEGVFFWLWERTSQPPFRDPSHAILGKPASFTMARYYSLLGGAAPHPPDPPFAPRE